MESTRALACHLNGRHQVNSYVYGFANVTWLTYGAVCVSNCVRSKVSLSFVCRPRPFLSFARVSQPFLRSSQPQSASTGKLSQASLSLSFSLLIRRQVQVHLVETMTLISIVEQKQIRIVFERKFDGRTSWFWCSWISYFQAIFPSLSFALRGCAILPLCVTREEERDGPFKRRGPADAMGPLGDHVRGKSFARGLPKSIKIDALTCLGNSRRTFRIAMKRGSQMRANDIHIWRTWQ